MIFLWLILLIQDSSKNILNIENQKKIFLKFYFQKILKIQKIKLHLYQNFKIHQNETRRS